jgi:hypothetical protein
VFELLLHVCDFVGISYIFFNNSCANDVIVVFRIVRLMNEV